ncbi:MAG: DUF4342 domain-containing protein [Candidatus Methanomethylicia archaeon]
MSREETIREEYSVLSGDLIGKIKEIIHEGNVTKIIVKNEKGETLLEIPVTVGILGVIVTPWITTLGIIAAMMSKCRIIVERKLSC